MVAAPSSNRVSGDRVNPSFQHCVLSVHSRVPPQQVLQHEIRKTHARNQKVEWVDDLVLMETIGKGGFGVVYKGSWKGSLAAIKVGIVHFFLCVLSVWLA